MDKIDLKKEQTATLDRDEYRYSGATSALSHLNIRVYIVAPIPS
jgi:hypothetical protein